ncbi:hypothetical protein B5X24_HaOG211907 [Helicoverpa armigera]|uniref:Uncharacterized protein n=1 Tax=Helicoverpa armigera TaxID=29058 RepID=A0A2W1BCH8_HELAM|nr:hypothetical protein B5X24_HaOG211907 [Helicoverpa armigera]
MLKEGHQNMILVSKTYKNLKRGAAAPLEGAYKVEAAQHPQQHDPLYYQNASAEMTGPTNQDGFLQSILNDEDLQLMDMAMNEDDVFLLPLQQQILKTRIE